MKWVGCALLLAAGFGTRWMLIQRERERIAIGEELCHALDLLRRGIFHLRFPLPRLMGQCCEEGRLLKPFWEKLLNGIAEEESILSLWPEAVKLLPQSYGALLQGLGAGLHLGEQEEVFILTREEIYCLLREERQRKGERERLITALCVSFSLLLMVVLV